MGKTFAALAALAVAGGTGYLVYERIGELDEPTPGRRGQVERIAPVEAAPVTRGVIELRREFTGTLTAFEEFVVAPKVSGRIEEITVDLADTVRRGQVVARLDNAEYVQNSPRPKPTSRWRAPTYPKPKACSQSPTANSSACGPWWPAASAPTPSSTRRARISSRGPPTWR
ncbi:MAG: biotin/lipoyl-binding protein [Gammaproteobacteria bacterium]|nr:biotin/lipoyl-binding protein [Gammaproteobacteria bacterium]